MEYQFRTIVQNLVNNFQIFIFKLRKLAKAYKFKVERAGVV